MLNKQHCNRQADYEKGIGGIGVGMNYLIRKGFLKVEDDICGDFDDRMVRAVMYDPCQDFSQYNGLTGYGRYWMTRLRYQAPSVQAGECLSRITMLIEEKIPEISITEQTDVYCFLHDLRKMSGFERCTGLLEECRRNWDSQSPDVIRCFPRLGDSIVGNITRIYQRIRYFNDPLQGEMDSILQQLPDLDMEKAPSGTGLLTGYAGEGLLRLTALEQANLSWMHLL